jgi:hypothetical protein
MQQNRVKKILREGGLALGTHVGGIPDPQTARRTGRAHQQKRTKRMATNSYLPRSS